MVHGVGLEGGNRPPHKQNKRGRRRMEGYNEWWQMARAKTLVRSEEVNVPGRSETFWEVVSHTLIGTTATPIHRR